MTTGAPLSDDPVALLVLSQLSSRADRAGLAALDIGLLAEATGYAPSAIRKALRRLTAAGFIEPLNEFSTAVQVLAKASPARSPEKPTHARGG